MRQFAVSADARSNGFSPGRLSPGRAAANAAARETVRLFMFEDPDGNVIEFYAES